MGGRVQRVKEKLHRVVDEVRSHPWLSASVTAGVVLLGLGIMESLSGNEARRASSAADTEISPQHPDPSPLFPLGPHSASETQAGALPRRLTFGESAPESDVELAVFNPGEAIERPAESSALTVDERSLSSGPHWPSAGAGLAAPAEPVIYPHRLPERPRGAWLAGTIEEIPEGAAAPGSLREFRIWQ